MTISFIKKTLIIALLCNAIAIKGSPEEIQSLQEAKRPKKINSRPSDLMMHLIAYEKWYESREDEDAELGKQIHFSKINKYITKELQEGVPPRHNNPIQEDPNPFILAVNSDKPEWAQIILAQDPRWANHTALGSILAQNSLPKETIELFVKSYKNNYPSARKICIQNCSEINLHIKEQLNNAGITVVIRD